VSETVRSWEVLMVVCVSAFVHVLRLCKGDSGRLVHCNSTALANVHCLRYMTFRKMDVFPSRRESHMLIHTSSVGLIGCGMQTSSI
jgi:hypothetical protein